jgi:hypothetical protein
MGLADRLLNPSYTPTGTVQSFDFYKIKKCPVTFTDDPFEYVESFIKYKLKPVQKKLIEDLFSTTSNGKSIYNHAVFISGMRCLGLGTEILMYDGTIKKIEDIHVGDLVMGLDSTPRKVLNVSRGKSKLYNVKQSCAIDYVINENHILSLKKAQSVKCSKYERYTDYPDVINISIKDYLNQTKKWKYFFRGYTAGLIHFKEQPAPIDPYLLGIWLGDGTKRCLKICSADKEIVDWLKNYAVENDLLINEYRKKNSLAGDYTLSKEVKTFRHVNPTWEEFKKLNLVQNKHIPQCYISNSKEIRLKILAGLLDTDGTYVNHGYEITLANARLAKDVKRLADTLGYRTHLRKRKTICQNKHFKGIAWRLSIHGNVWEIPCKIKRKKYKYTGTISNKENNLSSIKVKSIGFGEYAGITVNKDNLFCLADGTATHNSGKSVCGGIVGSFILQKLLAYDDPGLALGQTPGQKFAAEFIATSEQQSKNTAYSAFENIILRSPWWNKYIAYLQEREQTEGKEILYKCHERKIIFGEKNLEAHSLHSNSASIAGFTAFFVCFDEMSRFDVSEGDVQQRSEKRSAQAVFYTASRAAKTLGDFSKILTITSPMYETDFGMQLLYMAKDIDAGPATKKIIEALRTRYPKRVSDIIGYHYATWEANPKTEEDPFGYTEDSFATEKTNNYATFLRDYMAIPPSAISPFFELPERIDKSVNRNRQPLAIFTNEIIEETVGVEVRKYIGKKIQILDSNRLQKYFICCDQGAVKDSFIVAMGHGETIAIKLPDGRGGETTTSRYKIIIDFVEAWKPNKEERITVSFQNVEAIIRTLNSYFYIDRVIFDQWHSTESIERLFAEGIMTQKLGATLEMYETMKVLLYSGMVEFPDNDTLLMELRQLNVIKGKKVEHESSRGCFTGETKIRLLDGSIKTFKELAELGINNEFWVYACLPDGTILPAKAYNAHKTKTVDEVVRITLDNGEFIECTPDHLFMLRNGKYKQAKDLASCESLMPLYYSIWNLKYKNGGTGKYAKLKNNKTGRWNWVHRYIIKSMGISLSKDEVVHHINFKPLDNRPNNLIKLLREEHSRKHIKLNSKIHSPENIKKRIESFKKTYKNSKELQNKFKENGKRIFNDPAIRKKAQIASREYRRINKKPTIRINNNSILDNYDCPETLCKNTHYLNNVYWKSEKGIAQRKELSQTQFVEARNKRTAESFKRTGEGVRRASDIKALFKVDNRIDYALSYEHITRLYGGYPKAWRRRFPNIDFVANAKKLEGKSLSEILNLVNTPKKRFLLRMLRPLNMEYIAGRNNHKVTKIEYIKKTVDVYDITVPHYNNFALDSGIFVHNSKDCADAVCRVCYMVYLDSIRDTVHGKFMMPMAAKMPTIRSVATAFEMTRNDHISENPHYGIFQSASAGKGVFGKSMIVQPNVIPTIGDIKIK